MVMNMVIVMVKRMGKKEKEENSLHNNNNNNNNKEKTEMNLEKRWMTSLCGTRTLCGRWWSWG